jgi:hypothetical protein
MDSDNILIVMGFVVFWCSLFYCSYQIKHKLLFTINFCVHAAYSCYFLYNLVYNSEGGMSLVWWFYILVFLGTHTLLNFLLPLFIKNKNRH